MSRENNAAKKPLIFAVIGAANTLLDIVLLLILSSSGVNRVVANTISTGVAFCFSFFMNRRYTFQSSSTHLVREMVLFILVTLFGLWVIQNIIIALLSPQLAVWFQLSPEVATIGAKLVATAVSLVWNYVLYDKLVFRSRD